MNNSVIPFYCYVKVDNNIWFPADNRNALYKYNVQTKEAEWIGSFPNETSFDYTLFLDVQIYKTKLFFIPHTAIRLHIYDMEENKFESLAIPEVIDNPLLFTQGIIYEDYLYLIGYKYRGILRLDLKNYQFEALDHWVGEFDRRFRTDKKYGLMGKESTLIGSKLYIPCTQSNVVIEFDVCSNRYQFYEVGNKKNKYMSVKRIGDRLLLLTFDKVIVLWNGEQTKELKVQMDEEAGSYDKLICHRKEELWLFSMKKMQYLKINLINYEIKLYEITDKDNEFISIVKMSGEWIYFSTYHTGEWYRIGKQDELQKLSERIEEPRNTEEVLSELIKEEFSPSFLYEDERYSLKYIVKKIAENYDQSESEKSKFDEQKGKTGERIHHIIIEN